MPPCLYCRQENGSFTSVEHVIPEGLGNQGLGGHPEIVLPKGVVCDGCNHGKLSDLDQTLITFGPIALLRTVYGIRTKSGALPQAKLGNASIRTVAPGQLIFESNSSKVVRHRENGFDLRDLRTNQKTTPKYVRKLTRALFKMALGCIYIDWPGLALSERFDPVREMVLGRAGDFHGYLGVIKKVQNPGGGGCTLTYVFSQTNRGEKTIVAHFEFFGFVMFTDLEVRDPKHVKGLPEDLWKVLSF